MLIKPPTGGFLFFIVYMFLFRDTIYSKIYMFDKFLVNKLLYKAILIKIFRQILIENNNIIIQSLCHI
jgi:hypothetical protein